MPPAWHFILLPLLAPPLVHAAVNDQQLPAGRASRGTFSAVLLVMTGTTCLAPLGRKPAFSPGRTS